MARGVVSCGGGWWEGEEGEGDSVNEGKRGKGVRCGRMGRVMRRDTYPRQRQPRRPKTSNVREQPDGRALRRSLSARYETAEHQYHTQPLAHGAPEEQFAPSGPFDDEPADGGENGVDDHVDAAEEEADGMALVDTLFEEDGEVVDDGVATCDGLS